MPLKGGLQMFCRRCGQRIKDNEGGCPHCGAKAATAYFPKYSMEIYYCGTCGKEADREDKFCRKCGSPLDFSNIIADGIRRRIEKRRPPITRWEYLPKFPAEKEEGDEDEAPEDLPLDGEAEEETFPEEEDIPPVADETEPMDEPESEEAEEILAEEYPEPQEEPAEQYAGEESEELYPDEAPLDQYAEPYTETEESSNPDFTVTAPMENSDFHDDGTTIEENIQEENSPEEKREELINYSTDRAMEPAEKMNVNPAVTVTKPRPVRERQAFGIVAVIFSVLLPPIGIILGIIAAARGGSEGNKAYTRLGTTAIIVGVAMAVLISLLAWKIIIPAVEDYIKSHQTMFFALINL